MTSNLLAYYRLTDSGVERRLFWQKKGLLTPWTDINGYMVRSTVYGYRGAPKSLYHYTLYFMTIGGEEIVVRYVDEPKNTLASLRKRLVAEAMKKVSIGEEIKYTLDGNELILKMDSVEVVKGNNTEIISIESISSILPDHDGVSILNSNNEVLFKTRTPFYNRDILMDVVSAIKSGTLTS